MDKEISLEYTFGDHPEKPDTVVISITGTGINVLDLDHKHFMNVVIQTIGAEMYGKAHVVRVKHSYRKHGQEFYCAEWDKVGYRCEDGQCEKCRKAEEF